MYYIAAILVFVIGIGVIRPDHGVLLPTGRVAHENLFLPQDCR